MSLFTPIFNLIKPQVTDNIGKTIGEDLPANFDKIETEINANRQQINSLDAEVDVHKAEKVTDVNGVHGLKIESGTFTPSLIGVTTAGSHTYINQKGTYCKQGNMVHCDIYISLSAKDAAMLGGIEINNLPFVSKNITGKLPSMRIGWYGNIVLPAERPIITGLMLPNTVSVRLYICGNNISNTTMVESAITNTTLIALSIDYEV